MYFIVFHYMSTLVSLLRQSPVGAHLGYLQFLAFANTVPMSLPEHVSLWTLSPQRLWVVELLSHLENTNLTKGLNRQGPKRTVKSPYSRGHQPPGSNALTWDGADVITEKSSQYMQCAWVDLKPFPYPVPMEKLSSRKPVPGARKVGDCFTQGSRNQDNFERASLTADQATKATAPLPKLWSHCCLGVYFFNFSLCCCIDLGAAGSVSYPINCALFCQKVIKN